MEEKVYPCSFAARMRRQRKERPVRCTQPAGLHRRKSVSLLVRRSNATAKKRTSRPLHAASRSSSTGRRAPRLRGQSYAGCCKEAAQPAGSQPRGELHSTAACNVYRLAAFGPAAHKIPGTPSAECAQLASENSRRLQLRGDVSAAFKRVSRNRYISSKSTKTWAALKIRKDGCPKSTS